MGLLASAFVSACLTLVKYSLVSGWSQENFRFLVCKLAVWLVIRVLDALAIEGVDPSSRLGFSGWLFCCIPWRDVLLIRSYVVLRACCFLL